jgi:hypothetical protein
MRRAVWRAGLSFLAGAMLAGCSAPVSQVSPVQATLTAVYQANRQTEQVGPETGEPIQATTSVTPTATVLDMATATRVPPLSDIAENPTDAILPSGQASVENAGTPAVTPTPRKTAKYWAEWPVVPAGLSEQLKDVYRAGIAAGNDPHAFSTVGDCQSVPDTFMGTYDTDRYRLPEEYASLEETIRQFKGNFKRQSITVKNGQSVASVFSPAWADPKQCKTGETPLDCEFRVHKPSIVFVNLGTNWRGGDDVSHAQYLAKIVDAILAHGAVPILSSKGDNLEGDHRLNRATAQVAYDYNLPFWNFWASIRDLPGKGIDDSAPGQYLTPDAWARHSFTGLRALDAVWRAVSQ